MKEVLNSLMANVPYPLCIINSKLNLIFANKMYTELAEIEEKEIIGCNIKDILEHNAYKKIKDECEKAIINEDVSDVEVFIFGSYKKCMIIPIMDFDFNIVALMLIFGIKNDFINFRKYNKEKEQQYNLSQRILNVLPELIFYKNIEGRYIYANKECKDFYKGQGINNIIGKTDKEIISHRIFVDKLVEEEKKIIQTGQSCISECTFEDKSGKKIYKEILKIPIADENGIICGIVGRGLDITNIKENEEKLEKLSYTDALTKAKNRACFEYMDKKLSEEGKIPIGIIMGDNNGLKLVNDTFGHTEGDKLLIETANAMRRACDGIGEVFRFGGDEFAILIPNATMELCEQVIESINEECRKFKSEFFNISISLGAALKTDKDTNIYSAFKVAEAKVYKQKLIKGNSFKSSILDSLKITIALKSDEKEDHNKRVTKNCLRLAKKINMCISDSNELKVAAELHDIGIIGVKEEILNKKGALNKEEYEEMKTHCEKGYRIVKSLSYFENIAKSILHHHERWDGNGYPKGLKGEEIPLFSRIISICDSFDVMTNNRNYRNGKYTVNEALTEIKNCSGTQFDPGLVDLFISLFDNKDKNVNI